MLRPQVHWSCRCCRGSSWGLGPKIHSVMPRSTTDRPMVTMITEITGSPISGRITTA